MNPIARYAHWLHTRWPAGTVEKLPDVRADGTTAVAGVRVVGDLTGVPLLKFSSDTGARAVQAILAEPDFAAKQDRARDPEVVDVAIIGGGVSGIAAAIEAQEARPLLPRLRGDGDLLDRREFPQGQADLHLSDRHDARRAICSFSEVHPKEELLDELERARRRAGVEVRARPHRANRAAGRRPPSAVSATTSRAASGREGPPGDRRHRPQRQSPQLGVPGEELDKVYNRLYDPKEFAGKKALVVGGGDSALETAIALATAGAARHALLPQEGIRSPQAGQRRHAAAPLQKDPMAPVADRASELRAGDHGDRRLRPREGRRARRPARSASRWRRRSLRVDPGKVVLQDEAGKDGVARQRRRVHDARPRGAARVLPPLPHPDSRRVDARRTCAGFAAFLLFCLFLYNWKSGGRAERSGSRRTACSRSTSPRSSTLGGPSPRRRTPRPARHARVSASPASTTRSPTASARRSSGAPHPPAQDALRHAADDHADRSSRCVPLFLLPVHRPAVDGPRGALRSRLRQDGRRPPLPRRRLRSGA